MRYASVMTGDFELFDRRLLAIRRNRAAARAGEHDFLLQRVAEEIVTRLGAVRRAFPVVLDLGAYHGVLGHLIRALPGVEAVISAELSPHLLARCNSPRVLADEETLPFGDASLDLVVSGLALQLVNDLPGVLVQVRRALKPDGLFLAAVLGGRTLLELREAFLVAEPEVEGGASPRVAPFADVRELGGLLQRAGFALPVTDAELVTVTYASPLDLMRELKAMGASNALRARRRRVMTRTLLARACAVYGDRFGRADGRVPATFEIVILTGWAPHENQQKPLPPGSARMRLADALGTRELPAGDKAGPRR
jgi:NADH dehydrogenase [ubiquinone] 1 alpha subcomplex assembly factor 5